MSKDYYKILGVDRNASTDDIKKKYRKIAMEYHPDKNKDPKAEGIFKDAAEAYDILSNPEKKSNYDRFGTSNGNPFGGSNQGHGFDMNDLYSQFGDVFGDAFGRRYGNQRRQSKGSDLRMKVSLTISDILNGVNKKLKYKRQDKCKKCDGKGGKDLKDCLPCGGQGQRIVTQSTPFGQIRQATTCPDCRGSGKTISNKCSDCKGDGTWTKDEVVDVEIPAGVSEGMQLSMQGFGNYIRDGVPGDLQIVIEEIKETYFRREGNKIIVEKTISVIDAIIGSNQKVKTPHGDISFVVESGTEHGKVLRMVGKGIPDINYGLGDLYIKLEVKIPKTISTDEKLILEGLKSSKNFEV